MIEIRIHGRGGQGAVIASKIIALSFFMEGYEVQSFPSFGVERRGAPICAYTRVDDKPITLRSEIYSPDHVIILDYNLIDAVNVWEGLKENGTVLINGQEDMIRNMKLRAPRIASVDASAIAIKHRLGSPTSPIINTAIVGAFARFTGLLKFESIEKSILQETPVKQKENVIAAREAYDNVVIYQ